jgi:SAM-dependent methyltransferase
MEPRPYYHRFAWACDLLNAAPIAARIDFMVAELARLGVRPPGRLLDAGCGTGRYAVDLAAHGFAVTGIDQSPELIDIARRKHAPAGDVAFAVADLLAFHPSDRFAAVLCRGVLNDIISDADRAAVFRRFARWIAPGGGLILDVRDRAQSAARYGADPEFRREVRLQDGSMLAFTSVTSCDDTTGLLHVHERFALHHDAQDTVMENEFVMRCWSRDELHERMADAFTDVIIRTSYGEDDSAWNDRIVVIARRAGQET